jgi:hypothetical protein
MQACIQTQYCSMSQAPPCSPSFTMYGFQAVKVAILAVGGVDASCEASAPARMYGRGYDWKQSYRVCLQQACCCSGRLYTCRPAFGCVYLCLDIVSGAPPWPCCMGLLSMAVSAGRPSAGVGSRLPTYPTGACRALVWGVLAHAGGCACTHVSLRMLCTVTGPGGPAARQGACWSHSSCGESGSNGATWVAPAVTVTRGGALHAGSTVWLSCHTINTGVTWWQSTVACMLEAWRQSSGGVTQTLWLVQEEEADPWPTRVGGGVPALLLL